MEKSLKQIIYETNVLVDAHVQLRSFYYGDLLDIIKIGAIDYASCFLSINSASNNANFETFNLELFVFDILATDDSNRTDIENTTKRILNDLITVIRYSTRWNDFSEVLSDVSELKYYDNLQDRLSGWGGTLQLKVYSNDCLIGLPIDDYDFDMAGNFETTVLAIVKNTDNDILATKVVSDSDDTIIVPDITVTDSDGSTYQQAAGTNVICTAGGGSGDVELNGAIIGTYTAPNTFAANVTLDGNASGTWNSGISTWEVVSDPCLDATVENSDATYTDTVASGDTLVLPDTTINITDQFGNPLDTITFPVYSTVNIDIDSYIPPCVDATVENSDASYTDTVVSGGTLILPDTDIEVNGVLEGDIPSVQTVDIQVTDGVVPVTPTSVVVSGNTVTIEVPAGGVAPVGATLMKTGQTTSYRTGDDGDLQAGRATDFFTLASNNPFGNTNRFTDELGTQTFTDNIVIDWSTYDGSTVLGWYRLRGTYSDITWITAIDNSILFNQGAFLTGWRLPNINELLSLKNNDTIRPLNYAPFNFSTNLFFWSSTTNPATTGNAIAVQNQNPNMVIDRIKTNNSASYRAIPCRTFTVTGTILT